VAILKESEICAQPIFGKEVGTKRTRNETSFSSSCIPSSQKSHEQLRYFDVRVHHRVKGSSNVPGQAVLDAASKHQAVSGEASH